MKRADFRQLRRVLHRVAEAAGDLSEAEPQTRAETLCREGGPIRHQPGVFLQL
jgi:hypothetical protein